MPDEHDPLTETFPTFPGSLDGMRRRLEEMRDRRIRVVVGDPGGLALPTGMWVVLGFDTDLVWADATLSPTHQLVTICHEFGHMICGHTPTAFVGTGRVDGVDQADVARIAGVPVQDTTALLGRCGTRVADGDGLRREEEAEFVGRRLARPFLQAKDAELAALLLGR